MICKEEKGERGKFRIVPTGRTVFCWTQTQDSATLVLGYCRFSLREKIPAGLLPIRKERDWMGHPAARYGQKTKARA